MAVSARVPNIFPRRPQDRRKAVYVACSHRWLHSKLVEEAETSPDFDLVRDRDGADLIIYLDGAWPDTEAPDRLRDLTLAQLMRTLVFCQRDTPIPWAPGMYASLPLRRGQTASAFSGGFYVLNHQNEAGGLAAHLNAARAIAPDLLWSFMGTAANAAVRQRIMELRDPRALTRDTKRWSDTLRWGRESTHQAEAQRAVELYAATLGRSSFVVCPRGVGLSSIRLFEALAIGRCPVILADGWLPPPFVDWDSCSIRIPESHVQRIPEILRSREGDANQLGTNARAVWEKFFSSKTQLSTLVRGCLQISERITPRTRLAVALTALAERSTVTAVASRRHQVGAWRSVGALRRQ